MKEKKPLRGFTCSAFDLLHAGHVAMLEESKNYCDHLIVGLHTNPQLDRPQKNKPKQSIFERYMQLSGCKYVDEIIPYDTEEDLVNLLHIIKPDIRFLGEEYKGQEFTGKYLPIEVLYNSRQHNYSSSGLIKKFKKT